MSGQTWKLVTLALALTASIVVAKTLITVPQDIPARLAPAATVKPAPQAQSQFAATGQENVAEAQPRPEPQLPPPTPPAVQPLQVEAPLPAPPPEPAEDHTWIVTVVRGEQVQFIRYTDPFAKAPVVTRPPTEQDRE